MGTRPACLRREGGNKAGLLQFLHSVMNKKGTLHCTCRAHKTLYQIPIYTDPTRTKLEGSPLSRTGRVKSRKPDPFRSTAPIAFSIGTRRKSCTTY